MLRPRSVTDPLNKLEGSNIRAFLFMAALAYIVFVIYGSLVPLEFRALTLDEAIAQFRQIRFLKLGIGSRADWMANLLLFIPLTFLWTGTLIHERGLSTRLLLSFFVVFIAALLSVGIEFTQLFFPQRTVSLNDLYAEALGGVLGVAAWWLFGSRFADWLAGWQSAKSHLEITQRLTLVYLFLLFAYSLLPLDLTLSPVEVFHKFREGKLNLLPFARLPGEPVQALYELASDSLLWFVPALLWRWPGKASSMRVWAGMTGAVLLLEILQLFVYSRVSDVTDIFTAAAGAAVGVWAANLLNKHARTHTIAGNSNFHVLPLLLAAGWIGVILIAFWYPFDFRTDGVFLRSRLHHFLTRVPFEAYYFGTEYRAITEVLHKVLFFIPLGAMLGWFVARLRYIWRGYATLISLVLVACIAGILVVGRLAQPEKNPDVMDIVLHWLGGFAGFIVSRKMLSSPRALTGRIDDAQAISSPQDSTNRFPALPGSRWHALLTVAGMTLIFWLAMSAPFIPYNVRELFRLDMPLLSALLLSLNCYWLATWPVWLARRRVSNLVRLLQLPGGLVVYGFADFMILYFSVPLESLHDLVGSPVLNWPWQWEAACRWAVLVSIPGTMIYLATQTVRRWRGLQLGAMHFLAPVPVLLLAYWVVVDEAATDNLVELITTPHAMAFITLCAWLYTLLLAAALFASPLPKMHDRIRVYGVVLSLPLAALFLSLGLAGDIDKYGQRFSAMQFLLSTDRQHYASHAVIWLRYCVLHVLAVSIIASIQWPLFRTAHKTYKKNIHADH